MYLEWAPIDVFSRPADKSEKPRLLPAPAATPEASVEDITPLSDPVSKILNHHEDADPIDENAVPELDTTLFVKNLNFRTREDALKKVGRITTKY